MAGFGTVQQARELPDVGAGMRRPYEGGRLKGVAGDDDSLLVDVLQHFGGNLDEAAAVATKYYINERDRLNKMEMNNQIQEAELAWDTWSARALNGDGTGAITDVDAYLGEDYSGSKEDVVGLNHIHGMSAPNAAEVYRSGSSAVMNDILNRLSPAARNAVAPRLRERQIRTYTGLVANGYKEYKNAVEEAQVKLHERRVDLMCAETAQSVKMNGMEYDNKIADIQARSEPKAILAEVNARYASASANTPEMTKEDSEALRKKIDEEVRAELKAEKEKALNEKALKDQAIGAIFTNSIEELDNDAIALYCDKYGVEPSFFKRKLDTLSEDEKTIRLHIEHEISANKEKNNFALLNNLLVNGDKHGIEFVEDVLESTDEYGRIVDWGINNPILVDKLRNVHATQSAKLAEAKMAKSQTVAYDVSQVLSVVAKDGHGAKGWKISNEEAYALLDKYVKAGDLESAARLEDANTKRVQAERNANQLKLQRAEELEKKRLAEEEKKAKEKQEALKEAKKIKAEQDKKEVLNAVRCLSYEISKARTKEASDENGIPLDFVELEDKDGNKTYISMRDVLEYTLEEKLSEAGYTEAEIRLYKKKYLDELPTGDALYDAMAIDIFQQNVSEFGISSVGKTKTNANVEDLKSAKERVQAPKGFFKSVTSGEVSNLVRIDTKSGEIVVDKDGVLLGTRTLVLNGQSDLSPELIEDVLSVTADYMNELKAISPTLTNDFIKAEGKKMMKVLFRQDIDSLADDKLISNTLVTPFVRDSLRTSKTTAGDVGILMRAIQAADPMRADIARGAWEPLLEKFRQENGSKKGND